MKEIRYRRTRQGELAQYGGMSMFERLKNGGFKMMQVIGAVGKTGSKVHACGIYQKEENGVLVVAEAWTRCGSDFGGNKRQSINHTFGEYNVDEITCERCLKSSAAQRNPI